MTDRDRLSLDWCLEFAARMLAGCLARTFPNGEASHILRGAWVAACRELRFLEAMTRRLLVALAGELDLRLTDTPCRAKASPPPSTPVPSRSPHTRFCLTDPLPSLAQIQARFGAGATACGDWNTAQTGDPVPVVSANGIAARLAALATLLADPLSAARRMARWLGQKDRRRATPLRLRPPPGWISRAPLGIEASSWSEASRLSLLVLNRPPG